MTLKAMGQGQALNPLQQSYGKQAKVLKIGVKFYEKEIFRPSVVRRRSGS